MPAPSYRADPQAGAQRHAPAMKYDQDLENTIRRIEPVVAVGTPGDGLAVRDGGIARVDYHGGLRYPHLVRDGSKPALLDDILAPRAR